MTMDKELKPDLKEGRKGHGMDHPDENDFDARSPEWKEGWESTTNQQTDPEESTGMNGNEGMKWK